MLRLSGQKFTILAVLIVLLFTVGARAGVPATPRITRAERKLLVWHFDQCSYNALGSVMTYFYGPGPGITPANRAAFERKTFLDPLNSTGYGAYFGWAPWTGKMVDSGKMVWNGHHVTNLIGVNFSLATRKLPTVKIQADPRKHRVIFQATVEFAPGERRKLIDRLTRRLHKGPVIIWTPYAAILNHGDRARQWHQVVRQAAGRYVVPFNPQLTHAVAVFAIPHSRQVLVVDGSDLHGVYRTSANDVVCTAAAMSASVRLKMGGNTILSRCGNMHGDKFDVVFYKASKAALRLIPAHNRSGVIRALAAAGANESRLLKGYALLPESRRPALSFLLANMPRYDLRSLSGAYLARDVSLSYQAMQDRPWHSYVPPRVFLQYVLPYANLDETRGNWRQRLGPMCRQIVAHCTSAGAAALALNKAIFPLLRVSYNAVKRPKPNQSPAESAAAHYASCSGLSILLVDACRSVGVPARAVGTPMWAIHRGDANGNNAGNHTWVEIWDGQWHVLGASEVSPLDHTWFLANASLAYPARNVMLDGVYAHRIYAMTFRRKPGDPGNWFPMVWNLNDHSVYAEDVSADYYHRRLVTLRLTGAAGRHPVRLILHRAGRLIANVAVHGAVKLWLSAGGHYAAVLQTNGRTFAQKLHIGMKKPYVVSLRMD